VSLKRVQFLAVAILVSGLFSLRSVAATVATGAREDLGLEIPFRPLFI
jgi:hypothetical protein